VHGVFHGEVVRWRKREGGGGAVFSIPIYWIMECNIERVLKKT
jgi:hypothetical protein